MKKKIGIGIIVVLMVVAVVYMTNRSTAVEVNMGAAIRGDIWEYVEELGVVKSKNNANVYANAVGTVTDVFVDIGDEIKKGDVLVKLDGEKLSRQIAELESQRSAILAQYNEAKKPTDSRAIEKLDLEIKEIEKRIRTAEEVVRNKKVLYDAGAISNEEYQNALRSLETEGNNLEKVKLDLELMKKPVSENTVIQYEAQLKQLDLQRQALEKSGENFTIVAPIDGTVVSKLVEKGNYLQPGTPVMEIGNMNQLYIESDILVGDIAKVHENAKVVISNKDLGIENLEGVVEKIHPNAFSKISNLGLQQKRVKVDIEMKEAVNNLKPEYDLDVKIIADSKSNTVLIPENAVFNLDEKDCIFVVEKDKAVIREVKQGIKSGRQVEILSGLEEGDRVILSPDKTIKEGIIVKEK
ncbi:efflux RND transporter periplasmic adaptor subunit [Alkaliphilus oremlandii]|uniref:Efflux transporter, RND family, MFP subunit n=1 Tax=Alkaliphilus oremlandii (strain OhILAs) TaxID=350688 RepID=A8MK16_ALKOO|nr:efflux RND transporter periplasmic adaptor subunit [Alkaliphilus oremlandii]ABW20148.1 efflux transporter, RND family, MFP subunit [Alkaliphilus oremlandii OhILAs]